uniref:Uncharacterized protein n=1 Tax=Arundo donax TaxID=35708 RepID=A0A0A8ZVC6_ARUDO
MQRLTVLLMSYIWRVYLKHTARAYTRALKEAWNIEQQ